MMTMWRTIRGVRYKFPALWYYFGKPCLVRNTAHDKCDWQHFPSPQPKKFPCRCGRNFRSSKKPLSTCGLKVDLPSLHLSIHFSLSRQSHSLFAFHHRVHFPLELSLLFSRPIDLRTPLCLLRSTDTNRSLQRQNSQIDSKQQLQHFGFSRNSSQRLLFIVLFRSNFIFTLILTFNFVRLDSIQRDDWMRLPLPLPLTGIGTFTLGTVGSPMDVIVGTGVHHGE